MLHAVAQPALTVRRDGSKVSVEAAAVRDCRDVAEEATSLTPPAPVN